MSNAKEKRNKALVRVMYFFWKVSDLFIVIVTIAYLFKKAIESTVTEF
jgi:hypothetical protein